MKPDTGDGEYNMKGTVGFIGLGNMGMGMVRNLLKRGFPIVAYDILQERLDAIAKAGGQRAQCPKEVAEKAGIICIVVLNYAQLERVIFGERGLQEGLTTGKVLFIMSTISPKEIRSVAHALAKCGTDVLDAPISGGKEVAEAGALSIMVGGRRDLFDEYKAILEAMGQNIYYVGELGSGSSLKLVNNLMSIVNEAVVAEAMVLALRAGLDPKIVLDVIPKSAGDSWMFRYKAHRMVERDFVCRGELDIDVKDLSYILDMGRELKVPLFLTAAARAMFLMGSALGFGKEDDSAVVKVVEKMAGIGEGG